MRRATGWWRSLAKGSWTPWQGATECIRQAAEEVGDALRRDRHRAFRWLTKEVNRQARETRTEAFHVPRYGEMIAQAEALSAQAALPAPTRMRSVSAKRRSETGSPRSRNSRPPCE